MQLSSANAMSDTLSSPGPQTGHAQFIGVILLLVSPQDADVGKEWQRRPAGEQERRDYRYTSVDCPVQPALSAYASTDLLPTSLSQPRRLRFREGGPGHSTFCCSEAAAVRTRLPGSRVSEWQPRRMAGKWHCSVGGQDATGPSRGPKEAI